MVIILVRIVKKRTIMRAVKILIVLRGREDFDLIVHGIEMAKRTSGEVHLLDISSEYSGEARGMQTKLKDFLNQQLKEVKSVFWQSKGEFAKEVIKFVQKHSIDVVVLSLKKGFELETILLSRQLKKECVCEVEIIKR